MTAGIPLASHFVSEIRELYPAKYHGADPKNYAGCMRQLTLGERRALIACYVDKALINWAHVAIALLVKHGYVDRVLTTNFDPLVMRACALLNEYPAVYDLAASSVLKVADIAQKAIFHLHGQRTGFVLANTLDEFTQYASDLQPLFEDTARNRVWIVVGYSGESDPVFDHLAAIPRFDNGLYWITYNDAEPASHVREHLLQPAKDAHYVKGFDADGFFITLAQRLGVFPPDLLRRPFTHLLECLDTLTSTYTLPGQDAPIDACRETRTLISRAIATSEPGQPTQPKPPEPAEEVGRLIEATALMMAGQYDSLIQRYLSETQPIGSQLKGLYAWAYVMSGDALQKQAALESGEEADQVFDQAAHKYRAALVIKPDMHDAHNNWGVALLNQANMKSGEGADRLFAQAREKFTAALAIKPDMYGALNNWGNALANHARLKSGDDAYRLLEQACHKYNDAHVIKPDYHEALGNWGAVLDHQAKMKSGKEADRLFEEAQHKFQAALTIKPDYYDALLNWGITLSDQAGTKSGDEADRLYDRAIEKYSAALAIRPSDHAALNRRAIALNSWAAALLFRARLGPEEKAGDLIHLSEEKAAAAENIKAGAGAYNLACACARLGEAEECREWLEKAKAHGALPAREHLLKDLDLQTVRDCDWFKALLDTVK